MYRSTLKIQETMEARGLHCEALERPGSSAVIAGFDIRNGPNAQIWLISTGEENDVAVRIFGIINSVPEEKEDALLGVINQCYTEFRHVRFEIDDKRRLNVGYDIPSSVPDEAIGDVAVEMVIRLVRIIDACYPRFMKALWS